MDPSAVTPTSDNFNLVVNQPPETNPVTNYQTEISQLLTSVEKFRQTGQAEESEVTFAKEKVLPQLGYSKEEINQLSPQEVMIKLQEEADKKGLNDQNPQNQLAEQVQNLTDNLSTEINNEIKRQIEEKKSLEQAQQKINTVLEEHNNLSPITPDEKTADFSPGIGLFHNKSEHDQQVANTIPTSSLPAQESRPTSTDPLTASIEFALDSLKEGDKIGEDWALRKILTTSFGNKKSPFYELVNKSGASWTLSPEEMREVLRSNIFSDNKTLVKEIKGEKPQPLHDLGFVKPVQDESVPNPNLSNFQTPEALPENQIDNQIPQQVNEPEAEDVKNEVEPKEEPQISPEPVKLSPKQVEFLNKIHSDQNLWSTFTSFTPELWENFNNLYEQGTLSELGIDAHPLIDKLSSSENFDLVEIKREDNASKLLTFAGYDLSSTVDNPIVFAIHIIANHKLLSELRNKMRASGLASANLPATKTIINLATTASNGDSEALFKLVEALNFLPVGAKLKLVKKNCLETLKKYFKV